MRFGSQADRYWRFLIDGNDSTRPVRGNESGAVVQILKSFAPPSMALQIVYPDGAVQPRRIRLVIDHLKAWF